MLIITEYGEGNVFTGVCHSVHKREGRMHPLSSGCPPPARRQTVNRYGWYATYWKAHLLIEMLLHSLQFCFTILIMFVLYETFSKITPQTCLNFSRTFFDHSSIYSNKCGWDGKFKEVLLFLHFYTCVPNPKSNSLFSGM